MDKTLQRYHDQKLRIQKFLVLWTWKVDSKFVSLLEKWIPRVVIDMGVKTFNISIPLYSSFKSTLVDLPSVVFHAKYLEHLYLSGYKLNFIDNVHFERLQRLSLTRVYIAEETFEKIMSSCPLIDFLLLHRCEGLKTIKVNKHRNLKEFSYSHYMYGDSIEIDFSTSVETIKIVGHAKWYHQRKYFPHLKSLCLEFVQCSSLSFDSCNFPNLRDLSIGPCFGLKQLQLSNHSIKHLTLSHICDKSFRAAIDAPNIVKFDYRGNFPESISFAATTSSDGWKSNISVDLGDNVNASSSWFLNLNKLLNAVSQSEISLHLYLYDRTKNQQIEDDPPPAEDTIIYVGGLYESTIVVESLNLRLQRHLFSSLSAVINGLFRICRPRKIIGLNWFANAQKKWNRECNQVIEFLIEILRKYVEELCLEVFDEKEKEWHYVQGTNLLDQSAAALGNNIQDRPQNLRINDKLSSNVDELNKLPRHMSSIAEAMTAFMHILGSAKESLRKILLRGEFDEYPDEKEMHCTAKLAEMLNRYSEEMQSKCSENDTKATFLLDEISVLGI
ncbi:hypothetical protein DH2020_005544 [Rehmannia glutinosa]|uniref:Uncharacterized protein n=1 Tax=Rehmannia glutinosa TaxID=99300 RepID=A0ABR0XGB0_REHGL